MLVVDVLIKALEEIGYMLLPRGNRYDAAPFFVIKVTKKALAEIKKRNPPFFHYSTRAPKGS